MNAGSAAPASARAHGTDAGRTAGGALGGRNPAAASVRAQSRSRCTQLLSAHKGEAENLIRESSAALDWTIFQPSVIFGPGDSFLNRFAGLLATIPGVLPLAKPNARFQPVLVDDVIEAMRRCLHGGACSRQTYELGGPQVYTLREIVGLVAKLTGRRRWVLGLPEPLARFPERIMDFVPGVPFPATTTAR